MKKTSLLILFTLVITYNLSAQIENSIYPDLPNTLYVHLDVIDDHVYTSGTCDIISVSHDRGQNWSFVELQESIRDLKILPNSNGSLALYLSSSKLHLFNGNDLSLTELDTDNLSLAIGNFISLEVDDNNIYIIGRSKIYQTTLGEFNWTLLSDLMLDPSDRSNTSAVTTDFIYTGSFEGKIRKTSKSSGETQILPSFNETIYSISMVNNEQGYIDAKGEFSIFKTQNSWLDKIELTSMPEKINPLGFGTDILVTINTNRMYVSTDGGMSSTYVDYPQDGKISLVYTALFNENGTLYLGGRSTTFFSTSDLGQTYVNPQDHNRSDIYSIDFNNSGLGYALGNNTLLKTSDGGTQWEEIEIDFGDDIYTNSLAVLNNDKLLIGHSDGMAIYQNDVLIHSNNIPTDRLEVDNQGQYILAIQSNGSVLKSIDDGQSWIEKIAPQDAYAQSLFQNQNGKWYIGSTGENVYTSIDDGENWTIENWSHSQIRSINFIDDNLGIFSAGGSLYRTTNGGATSESIASHYAINNLHFPTQNHIFFTSAQNSETRAYFSLDGGTNFERIKTFCSSSPSSYFDENQFVWLGQKGGHINKIQLNTSIIDNDGDGYASDVDCDDTNDEIYPGAMEILNNLIDEDCDGIANQLDGDNDGYNSDEDCDDTDPAINPGATEIQNNDIDEDCDGIANQIDIDNDGFNSDDDCDDMNPDINPDAVEIPNNGIDEDCDGADTITSLNDLAKKEILLYPNPVQHHLYLKNNSGEVLNITIYDLQGREIRKERVQYKLDISDLTAGMYIITLEDDRKNRIVERIIKD